MEHRRSLQARLPEQETPAKRYMFSMTANARRFPFLALPGLRPA
jgi:hypothetical protein